MHADVLTNTVYSRLSFIDDPANRLRNAAGEALVEQCRDALAKPDDLAGPTLVITAGRMTHVRRLLHVVPPEATNDPFARQARL